MIRYDLESKKTALCFVNAGADIAGKLQCGRIFFSMKWKKKKSLSQYVIAIRSRPAEKSKHEMIVNSYFQMNSLKHNLSNEKISCQRLA